MLCFNQDRNAKKIPITILNQTDYANWIQSQSQATQNWIATTMQGVPEGTQVKLIPDEAGKLTRVLCCVSDYNQHWAVGGLSLSLPQGIYEFELPQTLTQKAQVTMQYAIAWGLGAYQFNLYKKAKRLPAQLSIDQNQQAEIINIVESIYCVRDWINTPADDMGPTELAKVVATLAKDHQATFNEIVGDHLLRENYAGIYTVGRASDDAPRLLELRWGNPQHPKVTLVGKGVCFDSGGLDLKGSQNMLLMKKDMGGAAHVLGLARMIMVAQLPIALRVLIPAVENVISGNAYRPGDVITMRNGLTVEIGNTDAEGRVVLADALTEAASEKPQFIIDMSTLTGAARVALGTDLPALFSNDDALANAIIAAGEKQQDPVWRMPLFAAYREYINSTIADLNNNASQPYGGAITAALFLKEFVGNIPWVHFDIMAWNLTSRPGRPQGGEAMALRGLFEYMKNI